VNPGWRWWAAFGLALLAIVVINIGVERRDNAATARKFCTVVATTDDAYRAAPPTTETGRKLAVSFAKLRRDLGCPS
jgi:hypothetical protein